MRAAVHFLIALLLWPGAAQGQVKKKGKEAPRTVETFVPDLDPEEGKKKTKKHDITQTLPLLREPPSAVAADVSKLNFFHSDLSAKGLLSQQTRDAIKSLFQKSKGSSIIKIRAFVAGSGDLRRVPAIVSEVFEERRQAIPVVTAVQVGTLPLEGAQVILEATAVDRRMLHENGLLFLSGHAAKPEAEAETLVDSLRKQGVENTAVGRVTCFLNRGDVSGAVRGRLTAAFPNAAVNVVQTQRLPAELFEECEAVASAAKAPSKAVEFDEGVPGSFSKVAAVKPGKIALSGLQLAFRNDDDDVRRAFTRTAKALEAVGAKVENSVFTNFYPVTRSVGDRARKIRFEFYDSDNPPANTLLLFEGLPSNDAILGIEAIALVN